MVGYTYKRYKQLPKAGSLAAGPRRVKVGFPSGAAKGGVIDRAFFNEFGTKGSGTIFTRRGVTGFGGPIPERPFMRNAMRNNKGKYQNAMRVGAKKILAGDAPMSLVLTNLGQLAQHDVRGEIDSMSSPPNSPLTVEIKGSSKPLIDTGEMRNAVTYKVEK